jgi:membrane-bound serine protease (ClpP class)
LFFAALSGNTYYGIAVSIEETLAILMIIIALILVFIFYTGVKAQFAKVRTGKEAIIGAKGIATSDLKPKGEVRIMGEFWEATANGSEVLTGQPIEVIGMNDMVLVVKAAERKA